MDTQVQQDRAATPGGAYAAGERVLSSRELFLTPVHPSAAKEKESPFRRDAETSTPGGVRFPEHHGTSPDRQKMINHVSAATDRFIYGYADRVERRTAYLSSSRRN